MPEDDEKFVEYYARASESANTIERFQRIFDLLTNLLRRSDSAVQETLRVVDIGCGAGTQCMIWARKGYDVHGLDINAELLEIARQRSQDEGLTIDIRAGSASALPWSGEYFDVCLLPELLEHVEDWRACLNEACRVLKPGGLLFLTTTNRLCPKQQEFKLIGYSWYPAWVKKRCVNLSTTTKRHWVEYAEYPAVHWFSPYQLGRELGAKGFDTMDRFDLTASQDRSGMAATIANMIVKSKLLRFLAHVASPHTMIVAKKQIVTEADSC